MNKTTFLCCLVLVVSACSQGPAYRPSNGVLCSFDERVPAGQWMTPRGFSISPSQARQIAFAAGGLPQGAANRMYYDQNHYYVSVLASGRTNTVSDLRNRAVVIDGRTGAVLNGYGDVRKAEQQQVQKYKPAVIEAPRKGKPVTRRATRF